MKIIKYSITKLFNTFNHDIDFSDKENISIILGQNGLGKTTMLSLLNAIFSHNFQTLLNTSFESIKLTFENEQTLFIEKAKEEDLVFQLKDKSSKDKKVKLSQIIANTEKNRRMIRKFIPIEIVRHIDEDTWQIRQTGEILNSVEIVNLFKEQYPQLKDLDIWKYPQWLENIILSIHVEFISTKRLQTQVYDESRIMSRRWEARNTIDEYAKDFINRLTATRNEASNIASEIDKTYPNRLIERFNQNDLEKKSNIKTLISNLQLLDNKRKDLIEVGLMESSTDLVLQQNFQLNNEISIAFNIYLEDSHRKLEAYNEMYQRVKLFVDLINKHFLYKKVTIDINKGIIIQSTITKQNISLNQLSSGEQHMFILYYHLLFNYTNKTLLLLDEPEISLHISWQKDFIDSLNQIIKLNPMTIIIATHAPAIVRNHWPLTIELNIED